MPSPCNHHYDKCQKKLFWRVSLTRCDCCCSKASSTLSQSPEATLVEGSSVAWRGKKQQPSWIFSFPWNKLFSSNLWSENNILRKFQEQNLKSFITSENAKPNCGGLAFCFFRGRWSIVVLKWISRAHMVGWRCAVFQWSMRLSTSTFNNGLYMTLQEATCQQKEAQVSAE